MHTKLDQLHKAHPNPECLKTIDMPLYHDDDSGSIFWREPFAGCMAECMRPRTGPTGEEGIDDTRRGFKPRLVTSTCACTRGLLDLVAVDAASSSAWLCCHITSLEPPRTEKNHDADMKAGYSIGF